MNKLITFDLHSIKIPELFKIPITHLSALPIFAEKIKQITKHARLPHAENDAHNAHFKSQFNPRSLSESRQLNDFNSDKGGRSAFSSFSDGQSSHVLPDTILVSPDMGGIRRIKILSEMLSDMPFISIVKDRDLVTGDIESNKIDTNLPDFKRTAKRAIIVDDMISTGRTIDAAVDLLIKQGIGESVVFATHPVFSNDYKNVLQNSKASGIFVTDTIDVPEEKRFGKLEILSVSKMIAEELK